MTITSQHCYASLSDAKAFISSVQTAGWDADNGAMLRLLRAATSRLEARLGGRTWGPVIGLRTYDLWYGDHASDIVLEPSHSRYSYRYGMTWDSGYVTGYSIAWPTWFANSNVANVIDLRAWLLSATQVLAYPNSIHTNPVTLVADTDYLLLPYDDQPANKLAMSVNATNRLTSGQRTLTIAGTWGWLTSLVSATTLSADLDDDDSPVLASTAEISPGQMLQIEDEQIAVGLALNGTSLTYARGANGTTAVAHTTGKTVSVLVYADDVVQATIEIAKIRFRNRDVGISTILGDSSMGISQGGNRVYKPALEEESILRTIENVYGGRALAGLRF